MKIIDLLNKIANGEKVPNKIEYRGTKFLYDILNQCYIEENYNKYNDLLMELSDHKGTDLNYEVEIIEEDKKIEKLDDILRVDDLEPPYDCNLEKIWVQTIKNHNKINELIDKVNSLENKQ